MCILWCANLLCKLSLVIIQSYRKRVLELIFLNIVSRLFACVWIYVHSRIFHSYGDVTFTGEGLQILTYARHLWPLSSEASLACHTYCDTGHPDYNGHNGLGPTTPAPVAEHLAVELSLSVLMTYVCCNPGSTLNLPHARQMLYH